MKSIYTLIFFGMVLFLTVEGNAQQVRELYGKIISMDTVNEKLIFKNTWFRGYKYFHDVFHVKIFTSNKDTIILGMVYNIRRDPDSVFKNMGLQYGVPYKIYASNFEPCKSNFPSLYMCDCESKKKNCKLFPSEGKIIKAPYLKILRIFDFVKIDEELWDLLSAD